MEDQKTFITALMILLAVGIACHMWLYADMTKVKRVLQRMFSFIPSVAYDRLGDSRPNMYMRLNEFKKVYVVNPEVYLLYLTTVDRYYGDRNYIIGFKGIDFYRYKRWRKKVLYPDFSDGCDEIYREFMTTAVQNDIDKLAKRTQREIDRSREEMMQSLESGIELKL